MKQPLMLQLLPTIEIKGILNSVLKIWTDLWQTTLTWWFKIRLTKCHQSKKKLRAKKTSNLLIITSISQLMEHLGRTLIIKRMRKMGWQSKIKIMLIHSNNYSKMMLKMKGRTMKRRMAQELSLPMSNLLNWFKMPIHSILINNSNFNLSYSKGWNRS